MWSKRKKDGKAGGNEAPDSPASVKSSTPAKAPSAAEFAHFRDLLQAKCDEADDLHNNLRLAKDSLRQLSEELDQKNTRCEALEEENGKMKSENEKLNAEIEELRRQVRQRDEVTDLLEGEVAAFRESLQRREQVMQQEIKRLQESLTATQEALNDRDRRMTRMMTSLDEGEAPVEQGRVHIMKINNLFTDSQ